ncbi:Muramoyltetrapeptide carboxypeptidase [Enhygromyxa salina]|uniref:Muramoyltetrapeptide carboxypeptidase n=1 Tax=Enhygromyxa salina TaxID=215803 RepID=A0A0C2CVW3_9BACT|nr:Muramoyltetrapeptide carboxypeptidase [Enhygromyxa salina]
MAPSGPVNSERVRRGLAHVRRRYGEPRLAANLERRAGYFAGDDAERLASLELALRDEQAHVIWAARGGFGATRLLGRLDPALLERPKLLVGFSDVSALLCWAWTRARVPSIHGPVIGQLNELHEDDRQRLWALLEGELPEPLCANEHSASLHGGRVEGRLIASNLEVLRSLIGTPHMPSLNGAILALEEVGERPYRVDRALTQLLDSGSLRGVAGVVVGDLHGCEEPEHGGSRGWTAAEVLDDRLGRLGVPVLLGLPFGHAPGRNAALGFGVLARLDADQGALEQLEPVALGEAT